MGDGTSSGPDSCEAEFCLGGELCFDDGGLACLGGDFYFGGDFCLGGDFFLAGDFFFGSESRTDPSPGSSGERGDSMIFFAPFSSGG